MLVLFIILMLLFGLVTPVLFWWFIQWVFPSIAPMAVEFGGFWWGILHGWMAPANVFLTLIGRDVLIVAEQHSTGYIVGFIIGILVILSGSGSSAKRGSSSS